MAKVVRNKEKIKHQPDKAKTNAQYLLGRLLGSLTLKEQSMFPLDHRKSLEKACIYLFPQQHTIDFRISIPVPLTSGFYLVIFGDEGDIKEDSSRIQLQFENPPITAKNLFDRCFNPLATEEKALFSLEQINILERAFQCFVPKKHKFYAKISARTSPNTCFYLVILCGPERRQKDRIINERRKFWIFFITSMLSMGIVIGSAYGSRFLVSTLDRSNKSDANPTVLPWIETKGDCIGEHRFWHDDQCWDKEHDPSF